MSLLARGVELFYYYYYYNYYYYCTILYYTILYHTILDYTNIIVGAGCLMFMTHLLHARM
jgi:hypothetical protein